MKTLYIIGNGFDLWHGLPTRYQDFSKYTLDNEIYFDEYFNFKSNENYLWTDFENDLSTFDFEGFYKENNNVDIMDDDFRPSMMFCVEDDITEQSNQLVETINNTFYDWINEIELDRVKKKYDFRSNSFFISFNYTSVLTDIYNIKNDNIFYIHGNVDNYDELIIGHNKSLEVEPEVDEEGNGNRTILSDSESAARIPYGSFIKPVNDIIQSNEVIFNKLLSVNNVVVLGHSLNKIDLPYFEKINQITKKPLWQVSYYNDSDKQNHISALTDIGIDSSSYSLFRLSE